MQDTYKHALKSRYASTPRKSTSLMLSKIKFSVNVRGQLYSQSGRLHSWFRQLVGIEVWTHSAIISVECSIGFVTSCQEKVSSHSSYPRNTFDLNKYVEPTMQQRLILSLSDNRHIMYKTFSLVRFSFKQEALQCFYISSSIVSTCALSVPGAYTGLSLEQSADFLSSPVQRYFNPALPELNRCNEVCQAAWQTHSWLAALVPVWWKCYTALSFSASARYSQNTALSGWLFCHHFGRERIRTDTHSHEYRHTHRLRQGPSKVIFASNVLLSSTAGLKASPGT